MSESTRPAGTPVLVSLSWLPWVTGPAAETVVTQTLDVMLDPSADLAVMLTEPTFSPETTPDALTVAMVVSLDVQVIVLLVALAGVTVAEMLVTEPTLTDAVVGIVMPVTAVEGVTGFVVPLFVSEPPPPEQAKVMARPKAMDRLQRLRGKDVLRLKSLMFHLHRDHQYFPLGEDHRIFQGMRSSIDSM